MKENKLVELSMDVSFDIINLLKYLKTNHEMHLVASYADCLL